MRDLQENGVLARWIVLASFVALMVLIKGVTMDKQIKKIEKETKKVEKDLKHLEKEDKKRDKVCDYGEKMMKKRK